MNWEAIGAVITLVIGLITALTWLISNLVALKGRVSDAIKDVLELKESQKDTYTKSETKDLFAELKEDLSEIKVNVLSKDEIDLRLKNITFYYETNTEIQRKILEAVQKNEISLASFLETVKNNKQEIAELKLHQSEFRQQIESLKKLI